MASEVQIFSQALVGLGDNPVTALTELNPGYADLFPQVKARVEVSAPWRFNTVKSSALTRTISSPATQYKYEYNLPPDILNGQPRTVWNSPANQGLSSQYTDFNIYGKKLLTSSEHIYIDYQVPKEVPLFPVHVTELLILALKAVLAWSVTRKSSLRDSTFLEAWGQDGKSGYFREAARIDSQGHPPQSIKNYPLIDVRHGGR